MLLSLEPLSNQFPFQFHVSLFIILLWLQTVNSSYPDLGSQNFISLSQPPETMRDYDLCHYALLTSDLCPVYVKISFWVAKSNILTSQSSLQLTNLHQVGEKSISFTTFQCASIEPKSLSLLSQNTIFPFLSPVINHSSSQAHFMTLILSQCYWCTVKSNFNVTPFQIWISPLVCPVIIFLPNCIHLIVKIACFVLGYYPHSINFSQTPSHGQSVDVSVGYIYLEYSGTSWNEG